MKQERYIAKDRKHRAVFDEVDAGWRLRVWKLDTGWKLLDTIYGERVDAAKELKGRFRGFDEVAVQ